MTTLGDLRSALRVVLNDCAASGYLWSDGVLDRHLNDAVMAYGRHFPRELTASVTTVADQAEYDLPAGCERVTNAELMDEVDSVDRVNLVQGGDCFGTGYRVFAGKLVLMPVPDESGNTVRLEYLGAHGVLVGDGDVSTVPAWDEDLVVVLAAGRALQGLASEEAKRRRFEGRTGQSADGAAEAYLEMFREGVRQRGRRLRMSKLTVR